jgi:hypothetical protein
MLELQRGDQKIGIDVDVFKYRIPLLDIQLPDK